MGSLTLPPYSQLAPYEGGGNYAVKKYYSFPYRFFYRKKLNMIVDMMPEGHVYNNILDYGAGPGIFTPELKKHAVNVKSFNIGDVIDPRWSFDAVVCASLLEFVSLRSTIPRISKIMIPNGTLLVASPIKNRITDAYFKLYKSPFDRNSHDKIIHEISKYFRILEYNRWMNLYFSIKATKQV